MPQRRPDEGAVKKPDPRKNKTGGTKAEAVAGPSTKSGAVAVPKAAAVPKATTVEQEEDNLKTANKTIAVLKDRLNKRDAKVKTIRGHRESFKGYLFKLIADRNMPISDRLRDYENDSTDASDPDDEGPSDEDSGEDSSSSGSEDSENGTDGDGKNSVKSEKDTGITKGIDEADNDDNNNLYSDNNSESANDGANKPQANG
ncbi:hypothetical protein BDV95DRAFT_664924 [Massariosphaeria phaeospora]|uniref:Uncharacterized protein n=1 Tax=Massariosphaeria phaeospora TaxID=100035 RepID=A0A7C8MDA0_9PLEO|nr:hypothetical protein BDV95DRAFT_664924 [Massariosphaeria phaeospora]